MIFFEEVLNLVGKEQMSFLTPKRYNDAPERVLGLLTDYLLGDPET